MERKLLASQFQSGNPKHMDLIRDMGISIVSLPDGRVQLLHNYANVSFITNLRVKFFYEKFDFQAASPNDGEEGLLFMQEMIELSKQQVKK